jgi:hypothetical protein
MNGDTMVANITEWLTIGDVARHLNLSTQHTRRLVNQDRFTAVRTRLGWLVEPQSVANYTPPPKARKKRAAA